jgi:hypothetical protein
VSATLRADAADEKADHERPNRGTNAHDHGAFFIDEVDLEIPSNRGELLSSRRLLGSEPKGVKLLELLL